MIKYKATKIIIAVPALIPNSSNIIISSKFKTYGDIIHLSRITYNENMLYRLFFLLSLRSMVLWIACGLTAFIFQHNVVCLDVPFHICPSVVGVDRKSTRLNSSHVSISYAVFCL